MKKITPNEIYRINAIIDRVIKNLELDLSGMNVLTEVGSHYFLFTPIIALKANANNVFVWTRDSAFGKGAEIVKQCNDIIDLLEIKGTIDYAINERPVTHIKKADIITNLGFVRPLNEALLKFADPSKSVIPAMCEAWEVRREDVDLEFCREKGIKVAGTNENDPSIEVFNGCGPLAIKMANEAGYEVYQNRIIIWSDDQFGEVVEKAFLDYGADAVIKTTDKAILKASIAETDFIFFCDYSETRPVFASNGFIDVDELAGINPGFGVVHLYGDIDHTYLQNKGVRVYPGIKGYALKMSLTLAHLGPTPVINLHTAGLKVGEYLKKNRTHPLVQKM